MLYFMQAVDGGPIKIGLADRPEARLRQVRLMCPVSVRIMATMPGGVDLECELHRRFAEHNRHGEWFEPADSLLAYIKAHADPWGRPVPADRRSRHLAKRPATFILAWKRPFGEWVHRLALAHGQTVPELVETAVAFYARFKGLPPGPRRLATPECWPRESKPCAAYTIRCTQEWLAWVKSVRGRWTTQGLITTVLRFFAAESEENSIGFPVGHSR